MKKKNKKQFLRRRKNPYNIDSQFMGLLALAIFRNEPRFLSDALTYKSVGYTCKDCNEDYQNCVCEGDIDIIAGEKFRQSRACRYCGQNNCLCDYGIDKDYHDGNIFGGMRTKNDFLGDIIIDRVVKQYLNKEQMIDFLNALISNKKKANISQQKIDKLIYKLENMIFNKIYEENNQKEK